MSNYAGIGNKQSHQQRFINSGDNNSYNKNYLQGPQTDRSGSSYSTKQNTSLTPKRNNINEKSKIGGGQASYGQQNQRGGNSSTHEVSHGWKDGLLGSSNITPSNSSNEFYTNKSSVKSSQLQRQEPKNQMISSQRPNYQQDQQINYLSSSQVGGQLRNNANMTPRKQSGLERTQADKTMESSLERSRGIQRQGELTQRRKTGHNEYINDTNQEILNKLKQLSNSPISHSFHSNVAPAKTFNSQLRQGISSKTDYSSAYGQALSGIMNYQSKTPKSARINTEQGVNSISNTQQHQTQFLKGYETDRMKRSITPTEGNNSCNTHTPNVKLQEMLNRVQQLTSNLKTGSSSNSHYQNQPDNSPSFDSGYNLERRLTPTHQAASDGFSTRSDVFKKHQSNQATPPSVSPQQYVPLQQQIISAMNSSKSAATNHTVNQNYHQYLEQQQQNQLDLSQTCRSKGYQNQPVQQNSQSRDTSQKQINQKIQATTSILSKTINNNNQTNQKGINSNFTNNNQINHNRQSETGNKNQLITNNTQQPQQFNQNKHTNNDLVINKQSYSNKPQQKQNTTPTFAQLTASSKQLNTNGSVLNNTQKVIPPQNQFQNFSGKSNNNNNTEEANTTSSSGNTYGNISQSPSHNSHSQNDLSQENSQKKSNGQDAALLRLLQEKLGDQYSYLLAGKQIELETPRNNQMSMKASDIQREQSARNATPTTQHSGLTKQQSTPTIFSQSPQQSDNKIDNQSILKQQQGQVQQNGQTYLQDGGLQMAWLRQQQQQQQQLQQEEGRITYSAGLSSPSVNMYYPQFAEYPDFTENQENQQNQSSNQLLNNPSYDFSGNLTNSQYINHTISLNNNNNNLCSSPDLNQSNSQYLFSSPDLNNSTQNALFNPYMMNNIQQPKVDSQQIPFDSLKNNPANILYLQQLQQYQQQLQLFQAQQQYPNRSGFISNPNQLALNQMNMNQQIHQMQNNQILSNQTNTLSFEQQQQQQQQLLQIDPSLIKKQSQQQIQQSHVAQDQLLLQSQRILKEDSHSITDNNLQEEFISSSTSSTNTPVTIQINTQISNNEQQLLEQQPQVPDSETLQRIVKVCTRAEECIYELLQSREFEHQSHFLVRYHLLLPDLPLLQKLPIAPADMKEIQRAINMQILLMQVIVYEHIVVIKQLRESVRGAVSMNENLQNILNSFQYVHSSLILSLIIFEQAIQNTQDQGDSSALSIDISALSATIRERTKKRKMGFLLKNSDKLSMLKKFNDILQPLLQILIEGQIELKEEKQTESHTNNYSFYDKLLEIQDQIPSMPIESTIQIAEQLSKDNIQLIQDEADKLALIHERKAFTTIKESHGENQIHSVEDSEKDENNSTHLNTDSPQRSLKKQPTFQAQTSNLLPIIEQDDQENNAKQMEKDKADKTEDHQQKQTQETQQIPSQEQSICGSVNPPYLKDASLKKYTLVLDLDETLVHYQELDDGGQFLVRPYAETFLEEMSENYEIIIFTAALQDYADFILDIIDVKKSISHRFYRQHTTFEDNFYVKDLSRIGRNLDKTLIIDNLPENFKFQPENGIQIQSWYGEPEDRALYDLTPLLKCKDSLKIVKKRFKKVQTAFTQFREKTIQNISKGIQDPHLNLSLDPLPEDIDD